MYLLRYIIPADFIRIPKHLYQVWLKSQLPITIFDSLSLVPYQYGYILKSLYYGIGLENEERFENFLALLFDPNRQFSEGLCNFGFDYKDENNICSKIRVLIDIQFYKFDLSHTVYIMDEEYHRKLQKIDEERKAENEARKSVSCFVATAVFKDSNNKNVIILRNFRDIFLKNYRLGRYLCKTYYKVGPSLSKSFMVKGAFGFITKILLEFFCLLLKSKYN